MKVENIVFMQESDADEPLAILNESGIDAAMEYLKQWETGDHELTSLPSAGVEDDVFKKGQYIMSWNTKYGYIGLEKINL